MIRAAALAATLAGPAAADVTIEHHDPHAAPFATITLHNLFESRVVAAPLTFDTAHGPVVIEYTITWNYEPDPRDRLTILELPPGVIADPEVLSVDEQAQGSINLYLWQGM